MNLTLGNVNVVGPSGSGKSTFARKLAAKVGLRYIELDALFWKPNWQEPSDDEFFPKLESALSENGWVLDGNYNRTTPIKWRTVNTVIWLDYSFLRALLQVTKRALGRSLTKRELWPGTGNRESFRRALLNKDSIILWVINTHARVRHRYELAMTDPEYSHIKFIRLRSPREARRFLKGVLSQKMSDQIQS
jgi:adenylate kinase family enzyme